MKGSKDFRELEKKGTDVSAPPVSQWANLRHNYYNK